MNNLRLHQDLAGQVGACLHPNRQHIHGAALFKTCTRKNRFTTLERARKQAIRTERRQGIVLAVYECPYCHGYHLTRQLRSHLIWTGNTAIGLPARIEPIRLYG